MKKYFLTLSFLLSLLMVKGQNTAIGMSHLKDTTTGLGSLRLGNKSTDSSRRPPAQGIKVPLEARVYSLERRVVYLTRETIELRRKMDSLLAERHFYSFPDQRGEWIFPADSGIYKIKVSDSAIHFYSFEPTKCDFPPPSLSKPHAQLTVIPVDSISVFYKWQGSYSGRRKLHP